MSILGADSLYTPYEMEISSSDASSAYVSELLPEISRLELDLSILCKQIEELTLRRDEGFRKLRDMKSLLSPICRLPPEILAKVFVECAHIYGHDDPARNPISLVLAQICYYWRRVALSTPLLWSSIDIRGNEIAEEFSAKYIHRISLFLERSGTSPLSLVINLRDLEVQDLPEILIPSICRCNHLLITFDDRDEEGSPLCRILRSIETNAPLLESLSIYGSESRGLRAVDIGRGAPLLRAMTISYPPSGLCVPWTRLTHLHLGDQEILGADCLPFTDCLHALRQCVELTHCWFNFVNEEGEQDHPPVAPIILPKLRFLHLTRMLEDSILFHHLTVPNLRELVCCPTRWQFRKSLAPAPALEDCLRRSGCTLNKIIIGTRGVEAGDVIEWLRCTSSVTEVKLVGDDFGSHKDEMAVHIAILKSLIVESSVEEPVPHLLPNLHGISVLVDRPSRLLADTLAKVILSRYDATLHNDLPSLLPYGHLGFYENSMTRGDMDEHDIRRHLSTLCPRGVKLGASHWNRANRFDWPFVSPG